MKKIILCEGKTDAIILSYFLGKQYNWEYKKLSKSQIKIFPKFNFAHNESLIKSQKENSEEYINIELLFIVIPKDKNGNLELFLLDALKENKEDKLIVSESKSYIDKVSSVSYLKKDRYKVKAQLQSVLSVISPEWVFSDISERLKRVSWNNLEEINSVYKKLDKL